MTDKLKDLEKTIEKDKFLWETIKRLDFYINTTNTKTTIILAFNTFIITGVALKFNDILNSIQNKNLHTFGAILLGLICLVSLLSCIFAFQIINPFLKSNGNTNGYKSKIFFGDIASNTLQSYIDSISGMNQKNIVEDLATQVHVISVGRTKKFNSTRNSIFCIFVLLFILAATFIVKVIDSII